MIMSIQVRRWELTTPFVIARGVQTVAATVEVRLRSGDLEGRGEATGVPYCGETAEGLQAQLLAVRDAVERGADRLELQRLLPAGGARNALDCAFWDLEAKTKGQPVWVLAGVPEPPDLPLTWTLSLDTPDRMAEAARAAGAHSALKIKLGDADHDVDRVRGIRAARPDSILLCDVNQAWSFDDLRRLSPEMAKLGVAVIEQPLAADADDQLLGYRSPAPLCADESCVDRASLERLAGRYDMINIKLDKAGGLTEALALAARARQTDFGVFVGCMLCTSLGIAPARLLAGWGAWFDIDGPTYLKQDRAPGLRFEGGILRAPDAGLWGIPA